MCNKCLIEQIEYSLSSDKLVSCSCNQDINIDELLDCIHSSEIKLELSKLYQNIFNKSNNKIDTINYNVPRMCRNYMNCINIFSFFCQGLSCVSADFVHK